MNESIYPFKNEKKGVSEKTQAYKKETLISPRDFPDYKYSLNLLTPG
jgi:hypothetical protein